MSMEFRRMWHYLRQKTGYIGAKFYYFLVYLSFRSLENLFDDEEFERLKREFEMMYGDYE